MEKDSKVIEMNTETRKKVLFEALRKLGVIKDEDNWEIKIGGNAGGIRWIERSFREK